MNPNACEIYKSNKLVGILPYKLVKKTDISEEHILLSNAYDIKPGYILLINKHEKLYVTDVRLHYSDNRKLEIYYETNAQHISRIAVERKANLSLLIAFFALIASVVALFKK